MTTTATVATRTARLGLRATPEQEAVLRRAAEVAHKSLTDFILDSACQAAEQPYSTNDCLWCQAINIKIF